MCPDGNEYPPAVSTLSAIKSLWTTKGLWTLNIDFNVLVPIIANIIDEINENGEKLFKLVELVTDDKKFPQKKANRIVGAIRVKEREKVS